MTDTTILPIGTPPDPTPAILDIHPRRFTVTAPGDDAPTPGSERVRSEYCETEWLPYIGPNALLVARKIDGLLVNDAKAAFDIHKVGDQLGITSTDVLAACYRLVRFGLATFSDPRRDPTLYLRRHWPQVPAAIATPGHRAALMALPDLPDVQS